MLNAEELNDRDLQAMTGAVCVRTSRIVVVSPFPNRFRELITALSASCNDVMIFHRFEPSLLSDFPVDAFILDFTTQASEGDLRLFQAMDRDAARAQRTLLLVSDEVDAKELSEYGQPAVWPMEIPDALTHVNRVMESSSSVASAVKLESAEPGLADAVRQFKDLEVYTKKMTVLHQGNRIDLTKTEYELLQLFLQSDGAVLSRDEVMERLWGGDFFGGSNVVDVHVKSLRKKLGDTPAAPKYIATVRGVGYRLVDE
ncbi:winged helix-turn-helix domain-containing protein [Paenibacillus gansuensis]|uniref:Winged helix-turn-helix domain-containing protein n=1 Tax=Paenibacillus gansuensis TaxID=306542 RepID=A0ABW5PJE3_9BACL